MFYFSNVSFAQCDDCDVVVTHSLDPRKKSEVQLSSACTNPSIIHEWNVSSQKCGNNLGYNPWLSYNYGTNSTGNVIRLYNVYMDGMIYTGAPLNHIEDCEYLVIHCMYRMDNGTKVLICCSDPIQL